MLELTGDKLEAHNVISSTFTEEIADNFITCMGHFNEDYDGPGLVKCVAVAMLIARSVLGQFVESVYAGDVHKAPVDIKNLGYYLEQNLASLSQHYLSQKHGEESPQESSLILQ